MRVCFIYREKRTTAYSIEEVFRNVRNCLPPEIEQLEFHVDKHKNVFSNFIALRKIKADVYHLTGDCNYMLLAINPKKALLTIHDIGHLEETLTGTKRILYKLFWWVLPLLWSRKITVVSTFTLDRIKKKFSHINSKKLNVIYNPYNPNFKLQEKSSINSQLKILQIGGGENKNIEGLVKAVEGLKISLILVRPMNPSLARILEDKKISFEWHSNVSEEILIELYRQCDILFFASTYEGFGLPIIEAQRIGRPVITSNVCSMPEVMGESKCIVNPKDVLAIKETILKLTNLDQYRIEVGRGIKNVQRFEPTKIAAQYSEVYKQFDKY